MIALSFLFVAAPAQAQNWQVTATGSPDTSGTTGGTPPTFGSPGTTNGGSTLPSYTVSTSASASSGQTSSCTSQFTATFGFHCVYVPSSAGEAPPPFIRITETSSASWGVNTYDSGGGTFSTDGYADDGIGDPEINHVSSGTRTMQIDPSMDYYRTIKARAHATVTAGSSYAGANAQARFGGYSLSIQPTPGVLKVDQDQQVFAPAPTTRFSATVSNAGGCTVDWIKISVDGGAPMPATISATNPNQGYIDWDSSSAGNPSEHTVTATAQIHDSIGTVPLDSTRPEGNGRPTDNIIADIRLKSIGFTGNIALNQDLTTPVSTPEFTWNPANNSTPTSNPAAYVQGKNVGFTMTLCDSTGAALTGQATAGYTLKLQANPNATNAATGQPVPSLTLYDNTTASPVAPTTFSGSTASVSASTALSGYVARYTTTFSPINFYVQFTHVTPTPVWALVSSFAPGGNTLYAVVATPTAPMATPWVPVLNYACQWATGATDAASATTALAKGLYDTGTYNEYTSHAIWPTPHQDGVETFSVLGFLSNLQGDCRDFSDLMVCLSNAVGAKPLQSQRSAPVKDIDSQAASLNTKNFVAAPWGPAVPSPQSWVYHQWSTSDNVFDACVGTSATPLVNLPLQTYFSTLVDQSLPYEWKPQTAFQPTLSN